MKIRVFADPDKSTFCVSIGPADTPDFITITGFDSQDAAYKFIRGYIQDLFRFWREGATAKEKKADG